MPGPVMRIPPVRFDSPPLSMSALAETTDWGVKSLAVPEQWAETEGEGVTVCVCDTGRPDHVDLPKMKFAFNFTSSPAGDRNGHSTHCCGIIGARRNDIGIVGIAPKCNLATIKVLSDGGSGSSSGIARGIRTAVDEGANIISLSLGGGYDQETDRACDYALQHNVFVLAAAGNAGYDGRNSIGYPGKNPNTICVASYNEAGKISNFSSGGEQIDVAGPGEKILSTYPGNQYRLMSGTSMSTPAIAGLTALIISAKNHGSEIKLDNINDLRALFMAHSTDFGPSGHDARWGWGVPNVGDMVDLVEEDSPYMWL